MEEKEIPSTQELSARAEAETLAQMTIVIKVMAALIKQCTEKKK